MKKLKIGWTTVAKREEGEILAKYLVENGLAVCVQCDYDIKSFYIWNSQLESSDECRLMIKFYEENSRKIYGYLKKHHPYTVPQWIVINADEVGADYLNWANRS